MFSFFQNTKPYKIGFEDVLVATSQPSKYILLNTLDAATQQCLIHTTMHIDIEESTINEMLNKYDTPKRIIVYGKHCADESVGKKYKQLKTLGLTDVYVYHGGLFEWLLLQELYGEETFKTTSKVNDILKYRPPQIL